MFSDRHSESALCFMVKCCVLCAFSQLRVVMLGHGGVRVQRLDCCGDKGGPPPLCSAVWTAQPDGSHSNTECRVCEGSHRILGAVRIVCWSQKLYVT